MALLRPGTHGAIRSRGPRCGTPVWYGSRHRVRRQVLPCLDDLAPVVQLKMLWSAVLWLVCAARGCTVSQAHALPMSPHVSLHLPTSPHISPYLPRRTRSTAPSSPLWCKSSSRLGLGLGLG